MNEESNGQRNGRRGERKGEKEESRKGKKGSKKRWSTKNNDNGDYGVRVMYAWIALLLTALPTDYSFILLRYAACLGVWVGF